MIAIGRHLQNLGHEVVISVAAPYAALAEQAGLLVEPFVGYRIANPNRWYFVARKDKAEQPKVKKFREWLQTAIAESERNAQQLKEGMMHMGFLVRL